MVVLGMGILLTGGDPLIARMLHAVILQNCPVARELWNSVEAVKNYRLSGERIELAGLLASLLQILKERSHIGHFAAGRPQKGSNSHGAE